MIQTNPDFREFKVVMLGATTVGKSSIVIRLTRDTFSGESASTVGASFLSKKIAIGTTQCSLQIWDTSGSERYRSMASMYFQGADAAVIVYDVTKKESFDDVETWLTELGQKGPSEIVIALVGNKIDMETERRVTHEEGQAFVDEHKLDIFTETSALKGHGVNSVFEKITEILARKDARRVDSGVKLQNMNYKREPVKNSCC